MEIQAYGIAKAGEELSPVTYNSKPLQNNEILVKITHCGLCHTDLHLMTDDFNFTPFPLIPGHEVVGVIADIGAKVSSLSKGQIVGVGWQAGSCNNCEWCETNQENLCSKQTATCVGHEGGFADHIIVKSNFAVPIPIGLNPEHAAPLLCAGITVFSPLQRYGVKKGIKVGVIGMGGLGHLAIQFASKMGAEVTLFSSTPQKSDDAKNLGAEKIVNSKNSEDMKNAYETQDLIISTVSANLDWKPYVNALRPNGTLCFLGLTPENINLSPMHLSQHQKTITGSAIGSMKTMLTMLNFAAKHNIAPMVETMPMTEINTAIKRLKNNDVKYRFVLTAT